MDDLQFRQEQPQTLAPVQFYSIDPQAVEQAAPLLTKEAAALIRNDQAFGIAIVEEGKTRGAPRCSQNCLIYTAKALTAPFPA